MFTRQMRAIRTLAGLPYFHVKNNLDKFNTSMQYHDHLTRSRSNLVIPSHSLTYRDKTFIGITFYNKLPRSVREVPLTKYKSIIKKHLIENA